MVNPRKCECTEETERRRGCFDLPACDRGLTGPAIRNVVALNATSEPLALSLYKVAADPSNTVPWLENAPPLPWQSTTSVPST